MLLLPDGYAISSTAPNSRPARRSSFTAAILVISEGTSTAKATTSAGAESRERMVTACPSSAREKPRKRPAGRLPYCAVAPRGVDVSRPAIVGQEVHGSRIGAPPRLPRVPVEQTAQHFHPAAIRVHHVQLSRPVALRLIVIADVCDLGAVRRRRRVFVRPGPVR